MNSFKTQVNGLEHLSSNKYLLTFIVFLSYLVFHAWASHPIDIGGDAVGRWWRLSNANENGGFFRLLSGDPPGHHELRWAINFPAYLVVKLWDSQASNYYVASLIAFSAAVAIFWLVAHELCGLALACVFLFVFGVNDKVIFYAIQLLPTPFGLFYLSLTTLFLVRYAQTKTLLNLLLCSLFMFFAYGAKETNIFFFPGVFIWLFFYKGMRAVLLVACLLLGLLLIETIVVNTFAGGELQFGRLEALLSGRHVAVMKNAELHSNYVLMDVFKRWDGLSDIQTLTYQSFFLLCAAGLLFRKHIRSEEALVLLLGGSFAFFTTFFVVSLNPVRLGQPFGYRYLLVLVPFAAMAISFAILRAWRLAVPLLEHKGVNVPNYRAGGLSCATVLFAVFAVTSLQMKSEDINDMPYKRYGMLEADRYFDRLAETLQEGCPVYYLNKSAAKIALRVLSAHRRGIPWRANYKYEALPQAVSENLFDDEFRTLFRWWQPTSEIFELRSKRSELKDSCPLTFARYGDVLVDAKSRASSFDTQ